MPRTPRPSRPRNAVPDCSAGRATQAERDACPLFRPHAPHYFNAGRWRWEGQGRLAAAAVCGAVQAAGVQRHHAPAALCSPERWSPAPPSSRHVCCDSLPAAAGGAGGAAAGGLRRRRQLRRSLLRRGRQYQQQRRQRRRQRRQRRRWRRHRRRVCGAGPFERLLPGECAAALGAPAWLLAAARRAACCHTERAKLDLLQLARMSVAEARYLQATVRLVFAPTPRAAPLPPGRAPGGRCRTPSTRRRASGGTTRSCGRHTGARRLCCT